MCEIQKQKFKNIIFYGEEGQDRPPGSGQTPDKFIQPERKNGVENLPKFAQANSPERLFRAAQEDISELRPEMFEVDPKGILSMKAEFTSIDKLKIHPKLKEKIKRLIKLIHETKNALNTIMDIYKKYLDRNKAWPQIELSLEEKWANYIKDPLYKFNSETIKTTEDQGRLEKDLEEALSKYNGKTPLEVAKQAATESHLDFHLKDKKGQIAHITVILEETARNGDPNLVEKKDMIREKIRNDNSYQKKYPELYRARAEQAYINLSIQQRAGARFVEIIETKTGTYMRGNIKLRNAIDQYNTNLADTTVKLLQGRLSTNDIHQLAIGTGNNDPEKKAARDLMKIYQENY